MRISCPFTVAGDIIENAGGSLIESPTNDIHVVRL